MALILSDLFGFMADWFMFGAALMIAAVSALAGVLVVCACIAAIGGIGYGAVLAMQYGVMLFAEWLGGIMPLLKLSPREIMRRVRRSEGS